MCWEKRSVSTPQRKSPIQGLISSSFLQSDYCYEKEFQKALEKYDNGEMIILAIIIRECDWDDKALAQFQVLPKDAKPVKLWEDEDSAWLNVVNEIKKSIDEQPKGKIKQSNNKELLHNEDSERKLINDWANDTEVVLTHRSVEKIKLPDIYVVPDLEEETRAKNSLISITGASELLKKAGFYLVHGEEQQGKTSLLKYFFKELSELHYEVKYVDAEKIKKSKPEEIENFSLKSNYSHSSLHPREPAKVILIDNLDKIRLNT
uniref:TIR protein n=1 Tax=Magnetococcus massalia (strain MO-1) TaxID=451514 RepID=A0A1S7LF39_MAGMO